MCCILQIDHLHIVYIYVKFFIWLLGSEHAYLWVFLLNICCKFLIRHICASSTTTEPTCVLYGCYAERAFAVRVSERNHSQRSGHGDSLIRASTPSNTFQKSSSSQFHFQNMGSFLGPTRNGTGWSQHHEKSNLSKFEHWSHGGKGKVQATQLRLFICV